MVTLGLLIPTSWMLNPFIHPSQPPINFLLKSGACPTTNGTFAQTVSDLNILTAKPPILD